MHREDTSDGEKNDELSVSSGGMEEAQTQTLINRRETQYQELLACAKNESERSFYDAWFKKNYIPAEELGYEKWV